MMLKTIVNWYKENIIFVSVLGLLFLFQLIYVSNATINVPVMDYWRYINNYVDKCFMGGVTFNELYESFAGHKSVLTTMLFVINVIFFKLNVRVSTFFSTFIMIITAIIFYSLFILKTKEICLNSKNKNYSDFIKQILGILIIFPLFNLNQWEILVLEFATPFTIRVLVTIITFLFTDKLMFCSFYGYKSLFSYIVYLILAVNLIFAGYSFSVNGSVIAIVFVNMITKRKNADYKLSVSVLCASVFSMFLYLNGNTVSAVSGLNVSIKQLMLNFPQVFFVLLGSSVLHENLVNEYNETKTYYIIGSVLLFIYIFSIIIYLKKKYFNITYMPIMLICYTFCNMGCIYISRFREFGLKGMTSSRYVVDTTLGLIGVIWIFAIAVMDYSKDSEKRNISSACLYTFPVIIIAIGISLTNLKEQEISIYRCSYFRDLITKMINIDTLPDEELKQFQANSTEMVRKGVDIMKKYRLGVFNNL